MSAIVFTAKRRYRRSLETESCIRHEMRIYENSPIRTLNQLFDIRVTITGAVSQRACLRPVTPRSAVGRDRPRAAIFIDRSRPTAPAAPAAVPALPSAQSLYGRTGGEGEAPAAQARGPPPQSRACR
ncbi:unnamed protein product [Euphydryas editha]|uniref:Uncharacterized protein n=1 Tax=Euphydryas editha TaxID=104508 RepID=A0AAU9U8R8_EUPED|nr:unnamed protein product [Euphydryas editha]